MLREIIAELLRANGIGKTFPKRPLRIKLSSNRLGKRTYTGLSKKVGSIRIPTR